MKADQANMLSHGRCVVCEDALYRRGATCTRHACRMMWAEFHAFAVLQFITTNARWAGGNGCETLQEWMERAVRELPQSEDLLGALLIEIIEDLEA
jgi:hypothetical protein